MVYGSKLIQWETVTSDVKVDSKILKAKGCLDAGLTGTDIKGGICGDFSRDILNQAKKLETYNKTNILGGTEADRRELQQSCIRPSVGCDEEKVTQFLRNSNQSNSPIDYTFKPIWEILGRVFPTAPPNYDNQKRLVDLEAAFAFYNLPCDKSATADNSVYQEFKAVTVDPATGIKNYGCWNKKTGCLNDSACHRGRHIGSSLSCYCHGNECLGRSDDLGDDTFRTIVKSGDKLGVYNEGANRSCTSQLGVGTSDCVCRADYSGDLTDRYIWKQTGS